MLRRQKAPNADVPRVLRPCSATRLYGPEAYRLGTMPIENTLDSTSDYDDDVCSNVPVTDRSQSMMMIYVPFSEPDMPPETVHICSWP